MPLLDRYKMPPGGFFYREASVNWETPNAFIPFYLIVGQIQVVRIANPTAGLNPAAEACAEALDLYTCTRLRNNPRWCSTPGSAVEQTVTVAAQGRVVKKKCGGCGGKRRSKK